VSAETIARNEPHWHCATRSTILPPLQRYRRARPTSSGACGIDPNPEVSPQFVKLAFLPGNSTAQAHRHRISAAVRARTMTGVDRLLAAQCLQPAAPERDWATPRRK
jgi:hypothetical protein